MFKEALFLFGQSTIALSILALLARSILKYWLDKDVSKFKTELKSDADLKMAEFKAALEKENIQLKIRYEKVFESQANVLIELNKRLNALERLREKSSFEITDSDTYKEFKKKYVELIDFYQDNQLIIPSEIDKVFEDFLRIVFDTTTTYRSAEEVLSSNYHGIDVEKLLSNQDKVQAQMDEIPKVRGLLVDYMRTVLGSVENS